MLQLTLLNAFDDARIFSSSDTSCVDAFAFHLDLGIFPSIRAIFYVLHLVNFSHYSLYEVTCAIHNTVAHSLCSGMANNGNGKLQKYHTHTHKKHQKQTNPCHIVIINNILCFHSVDTMMRASAHFNRLHLKQKKMNMFKSPKQSLRTFILCPICLCISFSFEIRKKKLNRHVHNWNYFIKYKVDKR